MNIEVICRKSLKKIIDTWGPLPQKGTLAGGSLANLIWESVSGNKAVVSDIDIFELTQLVDKLREKPFYKEEKTKYIDVYGGVGTTVDSRSFYYVNKTSQEGIFNYIEYSSNVESPEFIIKSFDLNCTQVCYSIEKDRFFWSSEFEEFLKTGKILITNLNTPAQTVIRLIKKKRDMNADFDETELNLCKKSIIRRYHDQVRYYFSDKYMKLFNQFEPELKEHFELIDNFEISNRVFSDFEVKPNLYSLSVKNFIDILQEKNIYSSRELLFYVRNVKTTSQQLVWENLRALYKSKDYVDIKDIDFLPSSNHLNKWIEQLKRLVENSNAIKNFEGLKLSEQIEIVQKSFTMFENNLKLAISLLESTNFNREILDDEFQLGILRIKLRKIEQPQDKIDKILGKSLINEFPF
jgi:hypothetical protein